MGDWLTWLLVCGQGTVVDEDALLQALRGGQIAGAGLDVLASEPPTAEHPLLQLPQVVVTPHYAGGTAAAGAKAMEFAMSNCARLHRGVPVLSSVLRYALPPPRL